MPVTMPDPEAARSMLAAAPSRPQSRSAERDKLASHAPCRLRAGKTMAACEDSRTQIVRFWAFSSCASNQASLSARGRWIAFSVVGGRMAVMDAGVHLPLIDFSGGGFSYRRLAET